MRATAYNKGLPACKAPNRSVLEKWRPARGEGLVLHRSWGGDRRRSGAVESGKNRARNILTLQAAGGQLSVR